MRAAKQTDLTCISNDEGSSLEPHIDAVYAEPVVSSYNDTFRPLLGAVARLRSLKQRIYSEGPPLLCFLFFITLVTSLPPSTTSSSFTQYIRLLCVCSVIYVCVFCSNYQKMGTAKPTDLACFSEDEHSSLEQYFDVVDAAPIVSSFNDKIRPLLDAIDKLRSLMVMEEGIQLPTIVVVGDQSSGKSSVLESLAGISLPRGQGICTRVPLIMRLQHHSSPEPELSLEYNGIVEHTDEVNICHDIVNATNAIAGGGKGISNTPLTLLVKKNGVPDLTMVDLPGITRVPINGQPEDIYEQIKDMIMEYIKPEQSIILNVLSATVDFTTCESIRMSHTVDKSGDRTLAVVTKVDKAPEGLLEKVTADDVSIGLGYVCVRNRIGDETYEEARAKSDQLFKSHPLLSKIDKSMVGIPVLAERLVKIQASSIARNLPDIVRKINDKLNSCLGELNKLPKGPLSVAEATTTFMQIIGSTKESLRKILVKGEFDEFPQDRRMHCTARLYEMLIQYSDQLHECEQSDPKRNFLAEEIQILEEAKGIALPNYVPRNAFLVILQGKVKGISTLLTGFVEEAWGYIQDVVMCVLMRKTENYYQLQLCTRRAGHNLITRMKERSVEWMMETVEMESLTDYTCHPEYECKWNTLMCEREAFIDGVFNNLKKSTLAPCRGYWGC